MISQWEVIYQYPPARHASRACEGVAGRGTYIIKPKRTHEWVRGMGFILLTIALGGLFGPLIPMLRMEGSYAVAKVSAPVATPTPQSNEFNLIIPKIGVNSPVIANVDPTSPATYDAALLAGVAHASTSFFPDQNGTVYLFSHSTSYDWFVKDLNAVFYLLKNLSVGDTVDIAYHGKTYTYSIREKKIVSPRDTSYLVPVVGQKSLILETCWPPGSTTERLLVFADLVQVH